MISIKMNQKEGMAIMNKRNAQGFQLVENTLLYVVLGIGALVSLFPFYWMVTASFKVNSEIIQFPPSLFPQSFSFEHYLYVLDYVDIFRVLLNSTIVAIGVVILNLIFSSLVAYALAKLKFPGKKSLFLLVIALMMIPFQLLMVPLFLLIDQYGLMNTYWAMILPSSVGSFSIFLLRQTFLGFPDDYIDAALMDGANHFRILSTIVMPMAKPMVLTVVLINFYWTWNDFLWPNLVITSDTMATLPVSLAKFTSFMDTRWGAIMAAATFTALPIIILYMIIQKRFIESLTTSGIK